MKLRHKEDRELFDRLVFTPDGEVAWGVIEGDLTQKQFARASFLLEREKKFVLIVDACRGCGCSKERHVHLHDKTYCGSCVTCKAFQPVRWYHRFVGVK